MITAWRIVQSRWQDSAFSGEGARLSGGRWNSPGISLVYTSGSLSLAQLEILVHVQKPALLSMWVVSELELPDEVVASIDAPALPEGWDSPVDWRETQQIGNQWVLSKSSAVLRVPSAVAQVEYNYLLNPAHQDFSRIAFGPFMAFKFDSRLG